MIRALMHRRRVLASGLASGAIALAAPVKAAAWAPSRPVTFRIAGWKACSGQRTVAGLAAQN